MNYHRLKLLIATFIKVGAAQGQMKKNWNKEDWIMPFLQMKRAGLTKNLHLKTPTSATRAKYISILMKNTNLLISKSELSIIWFQQWRFLSIMTKKFSRRLASIYWHMVFHRHRLSFGIEICLILSISVIKVAHLVGIFILEVTASVLFLYR